MIAENCQPGTMAVDEDYSNKKLILSATVTITTACSQCAPKVFLAPFLSSVARE